MNTAGSALRVGVIGYGRIGAEHAGWIASSGRAVVAAVADETPARRALAASAGLATCAGVDELLRRDDLDAVLVATPTSMHAAHASAALASGRHVMVEKPVALDLPEARGLARLARQNGRVLGAFHNRRWDKDFLTLSAALRAGTFGRVINVESRLGQWASCVGPAAREYRPGWRNEAAFGGGGLYDWGSHFVDQLWRLMRPARPVRVFAQLRGNVWTADCDDFARIAIDFDTGAVGLVEINTTTTRPLPRWQVDGTLGSASAQASATFDTGTWAQFTFAPADGSPPRPLPVAEPGLTEPAIWRAFAEACRGEAPAPAVPFESVLPTMALLDAARESSRSGQAVIPDASIRWTD